MQIIHLIKLLWDPLTWMKSSKQIRHFEMAAIWFCFHNRYRKMYLRSLSSLCYILNIRLPAMRFPLCVCNIECFIIPEQMGGRVEAEGSLETWCKSPSYSLLPLAALLPCQKTEIYIYHGFSIYSIVFSASFYWIETDLRNKAQQDVFNRPTGLGTGGVEWQCPFHKDRETCGCRSAAA